MMQRFTGGTHEGEHRVIAQEPVGGMGAPEEIATAIIWLCSDAAAFVIGQMEAKPRSRGLSIRSTRLTVGAGE